MGDQGGLFYGLHMVEVDSRDYIYTGEVFAGQRIQRFVPAGSPRGKLLEQLVRDTVGSSVSMFTRQQDAI